MTEQSITEKLTIANLIISYQSRIYIVLCINTQPLMALYTGMLISGKEKVFKAALNLSLE